MAYGVGACRDDSTTSARARALARVRDGGVATMRKLKVRNVRTFGGRGQSPARQDELREYSERNHGYYVEEGLH